MSKIKFVIKRSGAKVPFKPERIMNAIYRAAVSLGGRDKKTAEKLAKEVIEFLERSAPENHIPNIEEIQDIVENVLIKNGHSQVAKAYILYRNERNQKRRERFKRSSHPSENIPWPKIWRILDWAVSKNVHTIQALNRRIKKGEFPAIVNESESFYTDNINTAAELISEKGDNLKMVIISGPSSSGKTTTTIKLEQHLAKKDLKFKPLNIDNYFFDLAMHPKDEFGDYDFETPQALDLKLINEHLKRLCNGEQVLIPFYNFKTGTRKLNQTPMKLEENEILLIDSLHGLFPAMTKGISDDVKFKLYLESLLQMKNSDGQFIRWTDLRMIRRMLRDASYRAYNPEQTLLHWHYVRASELRNIIPNIGTADYIINSGMPYELPLYKHKLIQNFKDWVDKYKDNPLHEDAYLRAVRVLKILNEIEPVDDDSPIPPDSVLREFIGGSIYKY